MAEPGRVIVRAAAPHTTEIRRLAKGEYDLAVHDVREQNVKVLKGSDGKEWLYSCSLNAYTALSEEEAHDGPDISDRCWVFGELNI